jgi:hypothetical protein
MINVNLGRVGFVLRHDYVDGAECHPLDVVSRNNALWACRSRTTDIPSIASPNWLRLISGVATDVLDALQADLDELALLLSAHEAATNVHSATPDAVASRIVIRDANGRASIAAPVAADHIARKAEIDALADELTPATRLVSTTAPLAGGGSLASDLVLSINAAGAASATADGTAGSAVYAKDSDKTSQNKAATPKYVATQVAAGIAPFSIYLPPWLVGCKIDWTSTTLPANCCWPNGDLILFADWPELKAKYQAGGFAGMLLAYNANAATIAANLAKWRPNAASPTGLYTPNIGDQFLRAWVSGLARQAGSWEPDQMRAITGEFRPTSASGTYWSGWTYSATYSEYTGAFTYGDIKPSSPRAAQDASSSYSTGRSLILDSSSLGVNYGGPETAGKNVAQPMIIYLGRPA